MTSRPKASAQLLLDLVSESLDPGYAAAAARHGPDRRRQWWERPAVALGCLLAGFVLVVAYVHTHRGAPEAARAHDRLVARVRAEQSAADALANRVTNIQRQLSRAQADALPASGPLARTLHTDQLAAALTAVHGPGLTVTLREPSAPSTSSAAGRAGTVPLQATNILTDRDVRSVVNQLWSDGAEAIAVNDIRLTATTAIRFAGDAVLVDYQPITSPYAIEALGNSDRLSTDFAQSAVASRYQTLVSADGIGFSFTGSGDLSLPAAAPVTAHYAHRLPDRPRPTPSRSGR